MGLMITASGGGIQQGRKQVFLFLVQRNLSYQSLSDCRPVWSFPQHSEEAKGCGRDSNRKREEEKGAGATGWGRCFPG